MPITSIKIPFVGPTYTGQSTFLSAQECTNFFLRPIPSASPNPEYALVGSPGLVLWKNLSVDSGIRGMLVWKSYLYAVCSNALYRIDADGTATNIGTLSSSSGRVMLATNGVDITLVDSTSGYVWDLTTEVFAEITDGDFYKGARTIVIIDGYYLVIRPDTGQVYRSDFNDGTSWGGLAFSTAGRNPDDAISLIVDHQDLWVLGSETAEPWYNTGAATFNFSGISGAMVEAGITAPFARTKANNAVYFLGVDENGQGQIYQLVGRQPKIVSTIPVDFTIQQNADLSDVGMFSYQLEGHIHIVVNFEDETFIYDSTTSMWHKRSSRVTIAGRPTDTRWRVDSHVLFGGKHIVGDAFTGKLYELKTDAYDEAGTVMIATRTSQTIRALQGRLTYWKLQVVFEPGVGLVGEDDPIASLRWSDDGGRTWSNWHEEGIGAIGETSNRANWHQLGQGRNRVFQLRISDAVKRVIMGAVASVEKDND